MEYRTIKGQASAEYEEKSQCLLVVLPEYLLKMRLEILLIV